MTEKNGQRGTCPEAVDADQVRGSGGGAERRRIAYVRFGALEWLLQTPVGDTTVSATLRTNHDRHRHSRRGQATALVHLTPV